MEARALYLRRHIRKKAGVCYQSWSLVESVRTARGPRQRVVATLGKLPGMEVEERVGWEEITRILDGKPRREADCFIREEETPSWAMMDLKKVSVERPRHCGAVYLGLALWKKLGLEEFCQRRLLAGQEEIPWWVMACMLVLARFCAPASELPIAESGYGTTALDDLLGIRPEQINDDRLYRALDALLPYQDDLCRPLQRRYGELFQTSCDVLLYDVTSTDFEGMAVRNPQARRGYSRDHRPDCVQGCIGLVVTPEEGLPLALEILDGNRPEVTTLQEMVQAMASQYGQARRVWVMARGMVSEENLEFLRGRKIPDLVGTPQSMLKRYEKELVESGWEEVQPGVEIKACQSPEGSDETFLLCRARGRKEKEMAILRRCSGRLEAALERLSEQVKRGKIRSRGMIERRIGRLLERSRCAAPLCEVSVEGQKAPCEVRFRKKDRYDWACQASGSDLLRTNWRQSDPRQLWKTDIQLTQGEESFRITKTDLGIRPIYHQRSDRVHAHILVCFLALAMWRTLQQWMKACGLGTAPRKLLEELRESHSLDVLLPARDRTLRLRVVTTAPQELKVLLHKLRLPLPTRPKILQNVVATLGT